FPAWSQCLLLSVISLLTDASVCLCVSNYLPSISSSVAHVPERYIWRVCIGLHSAPRYLMSFAYFSFYRGRFSGRERLLSGLALLCGLAENTGLLLLTYVSSKENHRYHDNGFRVFTGSSLVHMLITCRLWYVIKRSFESEDASYRWKLRLFVLNATCCLASYLLYERHNDRCEPGVHYQMFRLLSELRWDMFSTSTLYASPSHMGPTTVVSSLYWTETVGDSCRRQEDFYSEGRGYRK
uniref:Acyltransferase PGAP2 n=1 Tax=Neolamprologus brichardi TaxID=32507 RepID=A0A3Q4MZF1_NEOBR